MACANIALQAKDVLGAEHLDAVTDRGYFNSPEILACEQANITVTLPKPMTSGAKSDGRFGKQDFAYLPTEDVYRCPAGEKLTYRYGTAHCAHARTPNDPGFCPRSRAHKTNDRRSSLVHHGTTPAPSGSRTVKTE